MRLADFIEALTDEQCRSCEPVPAMVNDNDVRSPEPRRTPRAARALMRIRGPAVRAG
jgi:hypothetical protein